MFGTSFRLTTRANVLRFTMAKKPSKQLKKQLSPGELAKYIPEDPIPRIQTTVGFGLDSTFDLAMKSGATVVGNTSTSIPLPQLKK